MQRVRVRCQSPEIAEVEPSMFEDGQAQVRAQSVELAADLLEVRDRDVQLLEHCT